MKNTTLKKAAAECFGTLILVFFACGVAAWSTAYGAVFAAVAVAITFGLVLWGLIYFIGPISGCHVNPAVSFAAVLNKRITWKEFGIYVLAQFIGAIVGAAILYGIIKLGGLGPTSLGANSYGATADVGAIFMGLIVEIILTFVFVVVILVATSKKHSAGKKAGCVIAAALVLVHLFGLGFTGTSVNPARSFGPALMLLFENTIALEQVWVFLVAPMIGGLLAAIVAKKLLKTEEEPAQEVSVEGTVKIAAPKTSKTVKDEE